MNDRHNPARPSVDALQLALDLEGSSTDSEWFEQIYARGRKEGFDPPWARRHANPHLASFVKKNPEVLTSPAVVVGCGLGDDAQFLARRGIRTLGIDISRSAVDTCYTRFPQGVEFRVVDLLQLPKQLLGTFSFVFEAYTVQSLREPMRAQAIAAIASLVAPGGRLLVVERGRESEEPADTMPWPLTRDEFAGFVEAGLVLHSFEDLLEEGPAPPPFDPSPAADPDAPPPVRPSNPCRRFRALYRRR
jgi:SAM-dependent methyltransferase